MDPPREQRTAEGNAVVISRPHRRLPACGVRSTSMPRHAAFCRAKGKPAQAARAWYTVRSGGPLLQGAANHVDPVSFDDVVGLDVVEVADLDAALEVLRDLFDIVLESLESLKRALVNLAALANQANLGAAFDDTLGDEAAGHGANLGDLEDLADDGTTEVDFLDLGDKESFDGLLDVVGDLVDDIVATDLDILLLGLDDRSVLGGDPEADHDGLRGVGQQDVTIGDAANALEQDADRDLAVFQFLQLLGQGLDRALHVGLDDQVEVLDLLLGHLAIEVFQGDGLALGLCGITSAEPAGLGDLAGDGNVVDHREGFARGGNDIDTGDLDRGGWSGLLDRDAPIVEEGANPPIAVAAEEDVTYAQGSVLDQDCRDDTTALGERGLQAGSAGGTAGVGLELVQLGNRLERGQQVGDSLTGHRRSLDDLNIAAPLDGMKALLRELAVNLVDIGRRVGVGQIDLVQGDHDRDLGRLGMGDGLDGLGHGSVIGGHDQDHDVGHVGSPSAHGREGFVARGVNERDRLAVVLDLVGADVLGDAAALALHNIGFADAVQERRLAMVDMAQDRDDRGAGFEVFRCVPGGERVQQFILRGACVNDLQLDAKFHGEHERHIVVQTGVDGRHLAHRHQLSQQVIGLDADRLGEVADGDGRLDLGVVLPGRGEGETLATALLAPLGRRTHAADILLLGQQRGRRQGRGNPALDRSLVAAGAAAGSIGGGADPALGLTLFLLVKGWRRSRRSGRADVGWGSRGGGVTAATWHPGHESGARTGALTRGGGGDWPAWRLTAP